MGNLCFTEEQMSQDRRSDTSQKKAENRRKNLMTEISESDVVTAKLKIQKDRLEARIENLEEREKKFHEEAMQHARNKNKEKALYAIKQKKMIKEFKEKTRGKMGFIDQQIFNIEQAQDDIDFTKTLKHSNQTLKKLHDEIDLEEIEIAKELDSDGRIMKEELENMLEDEDDEDLFDEINKIEAKMVGDNLEGLEDMEISNENQKDNEQREKENEKELIFN